MKVISNWKYKQTHFRNVLQLSIPITKKCSFNLRWRVQSEKPLPFKDLNFSIKQKYTQKKRKKNDSILFAVKIGNIADITKKKVFF